MSATTRPVRHFEMPASLAGKLHAHRFLIARRAVQVAVVLLFFGTAHWGWKLAGQPLLAGNLSAAKLAGAIPLADPFAILAGARHGAPGRRRGACSARASSSASISCWAGACSVRGCAR